MRSLRPIAAAAALALLTAQAAVARDNVPAPDPGRGSIGIALEYEGKVFHNHEPAIEVYFVPVQEDADRLAGETFLTSNLNRPRQHQYFLINAKPGRYVAVAALMPQANRQGRPFKAFFSAAMIPLTEVTVAAGGLAFAGEYVVDIDPRFAGADPAQQHYFPMISPAGAAKGSAFGRILAGEQPWRATHKTNCRDPADEKGFWTTAHAKAFHDRKEWLDLIDHRLSNLTPAEHQN